MAFYNLHTHTHFSVMDGFIRPKDLAARIAELGQTAFAVTDHGTTSGLVESYLEAQEKGLRFVFGVEAYFSPDVSVKDRKLIYHLCLYAKNAAGYRNLMKLMTAANERGFYYEPRLDLDMLAAHKDGIICTSACMGGILGHDNAEEWASQFRQLFGGDFYISLHTNGMAEQTEYNHKVTQIARRQQIPLVAEVDAHYLTPNDAQAHRKWMGIRGKYYTCDDFYIMDEATVREKLAYLSPDVVDEAIANTQVIADSCDVQLDFASKHYPTFPVANEKEYFLALIEKGWDEKIASRTLDSSLYRDRLNYEISVLETAGYIPYLLICADLVSWAKSNGIRTGIGRGSAGGSLCCYLLGITGLDPIKYGLVFERFLHLQRIAMPDIDIDVAQSRRQEVIHYLQSRYGQVYQVRTFGEMQEKGALQRAGQALGREPREIIRQSKTMTTLDDIEDVELRELAKQFVGKIQNFGVHASALLIFPCDPTDFAAVEKQGDSFVIAYEGSKAEMLGIIKQDCLGLKTLDVIQESLDLIAERHGKVIDIDNLPEDDAITFDMLCRGETLGVFQIESGGMTKLVLDLQPHSFRDLIPLVALFRPGPLGSGMTADFVERRKGKSFEYLHPRLEPILRDTYGVILYQEQILRIAQDICGYSLGEGDEIRRAIGKKKQEQMDKIIPELVARGVYTGIDTDVMCHIADSIITFASYGFNKSHSALYGFIAYQTAWLKAHYPLEYMTALLNSEIGDTEKTAMYVKETKNLGIDILPPDINKSVRKWSIEDGAIRVGIGAIKGVGSKVNLSLPVDNYTDFLHKNSKVNKNTISVLIQAGCFDWDNPDRGRLLQILDWWKDIRPKINEAQVKLKIYEGNDKKFEYWKAKLAERKRLLAPVYTVDNITVETGLLGFSFKEKLDQFDLRLANNMDILGGELIKWKPWVDKNGNNMAFLTLRTKTNTVDIVMFASVYKPLEVGKVYLIRSKNKKLVEVTEAKKC